MSIERTDPRATPDTAPHLTESNGAPGEPSDALCREVMVLRARCSNLRHWCRNLLDDPASTGVLDESTVGDLRATPPATGEAEAHDLIGQLTRGGSVPANHPLAPAATDANQLRAAVASLTVEHERLRKAFFALYDHLHPDDDLNDEYFLAQRGGPMLSMADVLAELEREFGK